MIGYGICLLHQSPPYSPLIIMLYYHSHIEFACDSYGQIKVTQIKVWNKQNCLGGNVPVSLTYFHRSHYIFFTSCLQRIPTPPLGGSDNDGTGWGEDPLKLETGDSAEALTHGVMYMMDLIIRLTVGTSSFPFPFFERNSNGLSVSHLMYCLCPRLVLSCLCTSLALSSLLSRKLTVSFYALCDLEFVFLRTSWTETAQQSINSSHIYSLKLTSTVIEIYLLWAAWNCIWTE